MNNKLIVTTGSLLIASGLFFYISVEPVVEKTSLEISNATDNKNNLSEGLTSVIQDSSISQAQESAQIVEDNTGDLEVQKVPTDKELVDFAIKKITETDFGLRPDRYSIEQLTIIGKYIKGMPLTRAELEINLTYFLDGSLRIENENPEGPVGGADFEGKEEWVDAHAYNEGFKYWNSLVADGDAQAARLLGRYYSTTGYTDDAIATYKYIIPHLKTQRDKGYITYQLANELKEKEPFTAAVYYWLSISDFNSSLTNGELQNILSQYDNGEIQEKTKEIYKNSGWNND